MAERIKAKFGALNEVELRAAVESMFKVVDSDGSGMIDVDELEKVVQIFDNTDCAVACENQWEALFANVQEPDVCDLID